MVTTITFWGLLLLTNLSSTSATVLMGHFNGHLSFIAYQHGTLASQNQWPTVGNFTIDGVQYDYVNVNKENITFTGPSDSFVNNVGNMPHLSCCCPTMTGIKPEYKNPQEPPGQKQGAIFTVNNGILSTFQDAHNAVQMLVTLSTTQQIRFTGALGGNATRELTLNTPTKIIIGNTPPSTLHGQQTMTHDDFDDYYQMAQNSSGCSNVPSSGPPCNLRSTGCNVPGAAATPPAKPAKLTAKQKKLVAQAMKVKPVTVTDVDCSNSQWP